MLGINRLLVVLFFLLIVKFLYAPFVDWKNKLRIDSEQELQRRVRVDNLLLNQSEINEYAKFLELQVKRSNEIFPHEEQDEYKLILQKKIEMLCSKYGATLEVFDWVSVSSVQQSNLLDGSVNIRLAGPVGSVSAVHTAIESTPNIIVGHGVANWSQDYSGAEFLKADFKLQIYFRGRQK